MSSRILALDVSAQSTGWAIFKEDKLEEYGLIKIKPKVGHGFRLSIFEEELQSLFDKYEIDHVIIEDIYRGPSIKTFKILALFHGVAYKVCSQKTFNEPELIKVTEVRRYLGEACQETVKTKEQTFFVVNSALKLGLDFSTGNDITDACALALGHLVKNGKSVKLKINHKQFAKIGAKDESVQSTRSKAKRKQRRSKKSVSKARS